ncbi:hypothetical protein RYX36_008060 [Vicia faba]
MEQRKLVVMGIPWDVDTEGLKEYMSKFGELEDCYIIKERSTGRSRGFGYVTFTSVDDAKVIVLQTKTHLAISCSHIIIYDPVEMNALFTILIYFFLFSPLCSHFEKYGNITDLYMPKDRGSKTHRGIGFITFASADSVENLMKETHELGGFDVVVDRATPKARLFRAYSFFIAFSIEAIICL